MAVTELMLWSLSRRSWQTSLSVGRQCRLSLSFRRLLRFTGQSYVGSYRLSVRKVKEAAGVAAAAKSTQDTILSFAKIRRVGVRSDAEILLPLNYHTLII